jgi:hypothetical protein
MLPNHGKVFRPIRPGTFVHNPLTMGGGTIGLIATSDGIDRWIVGCYHVLVRATMVPGQDGEPIHQPTVAAGAVAETNMARSDPAIDAAAAKCVSGIVAVNEILALGPISGVVAPVTGMKVRKSGAETGVTDGVIATVNGNDLVIQVRPDYPAGYTITERGDSGSLWVESATNAAVALNLGLTGVGSTSARAVSIQHVLTTLGLMLV